MEIIPEPSWQGLARRLLQRAGLVMVLGKVDSGKSSFCAYLLGELLRSGRRAAYLDSDVGQASLGPPGTVSVRVFPAGGEARDFRAEEMFFVGGVNPARHIPRVIEGAKRMAGFARARGARAVVVDTSGLVAGGPGLGLKAAKARALGPSDVVAIGEAGELEPVLSLMEGARVHRLGISEHARARSRAERIRYRRERLARYLKGARRLGVGPGDAAWELPGGKDSSPMETAPGTVVGLEARGRTLALGVVEESSSAGAVIRTPLRAKRKVDRVVVGDFMVDLSGG